MIYLDNAATTLKKPECVKKAVCRAMDTMGNSGRGAWGPSLLASREIYGVREKVAEFFGAGDPEQVVFTQNATEALNMVISGLIEKGDHVITTQADHNSVLRPLYRKEKEGAQLTILKADEKGNISLEELEASVRENTKALICTHGSNVTGNLLPIEEMGKICREHNIFFILDGAQTAGLWPIHMEKQGIHGLCFTGHKGLMGPQGTGGLCLSPQVELPPFKVGGSGIRSFDRDHPGVMPEALEAGTLNGHGIAGLGAALAHIRQIGMEEIRAHESRLLKVFYHRVKGLPGIRVYGDFSSWERLAVISLSIEGYHAKEAGDILGEEYHIAVRAGAHCAPLMHQALGTGEFGTIRFSFSWFNTVEEAEEAAKAVEDMALQRI